MLITGKIEFNEKLKELEDKLNVEIHLINTKDLNSITPTLKREIFTKHLIVQGCEEIIIWLL